MKRIFTFFVIALGIFSSTNSFARESKSLKLLLDIPQDFCLHSINTPIIHQNNSSDQDLYFDIDLTEDDNDDVNSSEKKKCSLAKTVLHIDQFFIRNFADQPLHASRLESNYSSPPHFYFNSPVVLRL